MLLNTDQIMFQQHNHDNMQILYMLSALANVKH